MKLVSDLKRIAELLEKRNQIDLELSKIMGRPATVGHIGEFIASKI